MLKFVTLLSATLVAPVLGRTVHSVVVFSRHGDRQSRHFTTSRRLRADTVQAHQRSTQAIK